MKYLKRRTFLQAGLVSTICGLSVSMPAIGYRNLDSRYHHEIEAVYMLWHLQNMGDPQSYILRRWRESSSVATLDSIAKEDYSKQRTLVVKGLVLSKIEAAQLTAFWIEHSA